MASDVHRSALQLPMPPHTMFVHPLALCLPPLQPWTCAGFACPWGFNTNTSASLASAPSVSQCCSAYNCTSFNCSSGFVPKPSNQTSNITGPANDTLCCVAQLTYSCDNYASSNGSFPKPNAPTNLTSMPTDGVCCNVSCLSMLHAHVLFHTRSRQGLPHVLTVCVPACNSALPLLLQPCTNAPCPCSVSNTSMAQFNSAVRNIASMSVLYGGNVRGYFRHRFSNCILPVSPASGVRAQTVVIGPPTLCTGSTYENQPGVYNDGFCLDSNVQIFPGSKFLA